MQRILSSIERIWDICRPIIATQQGDDTQHEIAGAHEWLEEAADEMETGEGGRADDAHLTILSNCWRAIKEASNLMSIIFTKLPANAVPTEIVMTAGSLYMRWVRHIRHRGTFSSMATAFEKFLEAPALPQELRIQWLEEQLAFIATGQASTTRRSGAIPFAVLALVHSNNDLVGEAFSRLSQIVRDAENDPARIHAMHSIRVMLLDARHSHLFKRYFEETLILALNAYQTENWSVRNAALLLSANITSRAIGKVLNDLQYRSSRRTSLQEWQMLYPKTLPYFEAVLARSRAIDTMDPATYIVLLIMRSLDTTQTAVLGSISKSLTEPLRPLLAKREIKARQIAAQAMANFLDIQKFTDFGHGLLVALRNRQYTSFNEVHGHILVMQVFLQSKPPNQDSLADFIELARQFTEAVTSQAWPFLIRDDMLNIAAVLGGHAVEKQVPAALSKCSNVDCSDSLRRLVDGHGITSAELMGVLPMLAADPFTIFHHNLSERLYNTYSNTSNVPLREALLPVLGQATISSPTLCGPVLRFIHEAAQVDQSVESRQAAVSALLPYVQELSQSSNQQLFGIADMLLNDDDTVIRKQAAEVVAQAFNNGDSICQEQAEQLLSQERIKRLDSVDFATFLLARLTDLAEIDRLGAGLKDTKHDLFAEEPPNLFIEPYPATQRLFDNFTALNDGARAHALKECQNRISTCRMVLSQISDADRTNTLPLDPRRESLLLLRQRSYIVSRLASS
ncbi:hypothetical protein QFC21_004090 [Naganishia friedmannii]|uniref:Uncharacterized protein n=1 Tax=Naganishia friedmannii TaxID=89922 RepID=A0ACC2VJZ5_9TREE|nr:hypothetical protein QFC21_004090 [Naganishia friedmannii]